MSAAAEPPAGPPAGPIPASGPGPGTEAPPPTGLSHREIVIVIGGLMLGTLLAALDQTIVATALPRIVGDLGGLDHLSWVVTAYLLTSTASTPLYGKVSDMVGRKVVYQFAVVTFMVGSVLAGISGTMGELIAARAVQGAGAGGLMSMAMAIVGAVVAPRDRGRYQGYFGAVFALSSVGGPLLGGFFADHGAWRWVFFVNIPLGLLTFVVTGTVLNLAFHRVRHAVDWWGSALLVSGVTCSLLVTVWGGSQYPWGSPTIVGLGAAAAVLVTLFVFRERRAPEPILPPRLFAQRVFTVSIGVTFILGVSLFGAIVFLPLFLQVVTGASATRSGLLLSPLMLSVVFTSILSGRLISRWGRYRVFPIVGTGTLTLGLLLLSRLGADTTRAEAALPMVVIGLGVGLVMQVMLLAVQNAVAHRDLGTATASVNFFRSMGGAFGVAAFGAILTNRLAYNLPRLLPGFSADQLGGGLRNGPEQLRRLPDPVRERVVEAFARSMHVVFLWAVPFAVLAFLLSWALREVPLRESPHIGAPEAAAL